MGAHEVHQRSYHAHKTQIPDQDAQNKRDIQEWSVLALLAAAWSLLMFFAGFFVGVMT